MTDILLNLNNTILFLTILINLGLGVFIYIKGKNAEANRAFGSVLFLIAFWAASFLLFSLVRLPEWFLLLRRITPVGSALVTGSFLYFCIIFPKRENSLLLWQKLAILLPGYIFAFISIFTPLMVAAITIENTALPFTGIPHFGPLYKLYALYIVSYLSAALLILFFKFVKSSGREKLQIFYVLVGMGLLVVVGSTVSLILPILGVSKLFAIGPSFSLVMVGFITYAIIRYRLLNIEDFLIRALVFFSIVTAFSFTVAFAVVGNYKYILPCFTVLANFTTGVFVLLHNPKSRPNRSFFAITFFVSIWTLAINMSIFSAIVSGAVIWSKIAAATSAFIPAFFVYFSYVFPKEEKQITFAWRAFCFIPALIFIILTVMNQVVVGAEGDTEKYRMLYGPAFFFLMSYFLAYMAIGFIALLRKHRTSFGSSKIQIKYVFLGFFLGTIPPTITNFILPVMGHSEFRWLAPSFTIISFVIISYAILKHRLMSLEVVIQRGTVYTTATILIMAVYAFAIITSEMYFRNIFGYTSVFVTAGAALIIAIIYQPLIHIMQSFTDRLFFRQRYDYQKTLREISQQIASVIKLEELTMLIVSSFVDIMKVSEISFLLADRDKEHFRSVPISLSRYKQIEIDTASPVVTWLQATKEVLVRYEIEDEIIRQESLGKEGEDSRKSLEEVRDEMARLGISVWVPIISKNEIIGIIALGDKLSGDVFSAEDIGLLGTLANQAAVALDNARLYDEVVNMKDYSEEILQSMVSGVLTTNFKGKIVTLNQMAEKICGKKFEEVVGKTCDEIWGKRGSITQVVETALKDKTYINFEAGIASPSHGLVPVSFSTTLLRDHGGRKIGILLNIQDLTEVKELENKVRQADKLSALATMAAGMAHEIKNPLSSMKVLSQLMPLKYEDPEFRGKLQEILPREINRIDRIVESLLGFARATALQFEKSNINEILEENVKYFKDKAKEADIEIITNYANLPQIEVDRGQLPQVFSNLILNAIQAMPSGGKITISTLPGKSSDGIMQNIKIQVADTGYGIAEDMQKKLFDPFFTTKHGGTGLGLTISHSIVDGHRGYIDVESAVGKGTSFTITLPVKQSGV